MYNFQMRSFKIYLSLFICSKISPHVPLFRLCLRDSGRHHQSRYQVRICCQGRQCPGSIRFLAREDKRTKR